MPTASISEAKARLSALLDLVKSGEAVTITDRGKPVARLVPAAELDDDEGRVARLERAGLLRRPRKTLDLDAFLAGPRPDFGGGVADLLLAERRQGR
jgi:prevent-host-death family protein